MCASSRIRLHTCVTFLLIIIGVELHLPKNLTMDTLKRVSLGWLVGWLVGFYLLVGWLVEGWVGGVWEGEEGGQRDLVGLN